MDSTSQQDRLPAAHLPSSNRARGEISWLQSVYHRAAIDGHTVLRLLLVSVTLLVLSLFLGRSTLTPGQLSSHRISEIVGPWSFNLVRWELEVLSEKGRALFQPSVELAATDEVELVRSYVADARRLAFLESRLAALLSQTDEESSEAIAAVRTELLELRALQQTRAPQVERVLQTQVAQELSAAGLGVGGRPFPPVLFTFIEPPKVLIVSPRDRIATIHSRMLEAELDPLLAERSEQAILEQTNLSAYITHIGGLGTYPAMVVNPPSLPWLISTVAHEWVHNYLTLFPLGLRYGQSHELTTINETVASIVGDEIGRRVVRRYYPEYAAPDPDLTPDSAEGGEIIPEERSPVFNFDMEMRQTRLQVDALLALGMVRTAEAYMETRREYFVENGYPLRVLNQAYFAFHGSYGTSAASTSPLGDQLQILQVEVDDIATFLRTVRWITSVDDLEQTVLRHSVPVE